MGPTVLAFERGSFFHSVIVCSLVELPSLATLQMDMTKVREIIYNFVKKMKRK